MPGPYVEDEENQFDYEADWREVVDNTERAGAHIAGATQEDTLVGYIPWSKRRSCARYFLGFSYADTAAPWRLRREQPHRHPDYPWLRAFGISFQGYVAEANTANENNQPFDRSPFDPDPEYASRRTRFTHAICTVRYRAFGDTWFLEDDDTTLDSPEKEWYRNTLFLSPEPQVEALTVTGGLSQLKFSEGGGTGPTAGTTRFTAPLAELLTKVAFRIQWLNVDWDYLSASNNIFWPTRILDCIGRVNSDTFLEEFEPGTLLMMPPQFELYPWWVASDDVGEPLIGVNVTLNFSWFDPPPGASAPYRRGHNMMPWGGDGTVNGDGKFYRATRNGQNDGRPLIEEVPFSGMFKHVNDPS
jgi:hypothetical protein